MFLKDDSIQAAEGIIWISAVAHLQETWLWWGHLEIKKIGFLPCSSLSLLFSFIQGICVMWKRDQSTHREVALLIDSWIKLTAAFLSKGNIDLLIW